MRERQRVGAPVVGHGWREQPTPVAGTDVRLTADLFIPVNAVGGSANTKGSWVQVVAATTEHATGFYVCIGGTGANGKNTATLLDVGIGAASSEVVVLADFLIGNKSNWLGGTVDLTGGQWWVPIPIPAGSRIAVRVQGAQTSKSVYLTVVPVNGGRPNIRATSTSYGVVTATSRGTSVTSGSSGYGSWVELAAATTAPIDAVVVGMDLAGGNSISPSTINTLQIGIGGSGSEAPILLPIPLTRLAGNECVLPAIHGGWLLGQRIPAGTRLAARTAGASATAIGVAVYGITLGNPWSLT